ncbi:MAG: hypothetical protein ACRDEA_14660, partial [Microcystaceae cyanobacterium]
MRIIKMFEWLRQFFKATPVILGASVLVSPSSIAAPTDRVNGIFPQPEAANTNELNLNSPSPLLAQTVP